MSSILTTNPYRIYFFIFDIIKLVILTKRNYMHHKILKEILSHRNEEKAKVLAGFFKTGKGQYGEGDVFLGITVPISRGIAMKYIDLSLDDVEYLIKSKYHEVRLVAILILVARYKKAKQDLVSKISPKRKVLVDFYLKNAKFINNWDLVDLSASYVLGDYLATNRSQIKMLEKLAKSENLWERRISIVSTFAFIYNKESEQTFKIVNLLMKDRQDLIHKACGWMLREVGKRASEKELTEYLYLHIHEMPRTMLRYAIERLPEKLRMHYLKK